jgi:hypothetical protein
MLAHNFAGHVSNLTTLEARHIEKSVTRVVTIFFMCDLKDESFPDTSA